ncbi:hypothetical protein B0T18DRAFT_466281 [Schizothecium vesticola]|uniref:Actin-like ATPase domain-containing protein n=1 Tax=Schizothecium vesticola TaxID=314040 RepID=A0AA40EWM9_9PEZI|nr:hypothetical protein B0T18DRAFT_466281 [Schizothecium vesticola]
MAPQRNTAAALRDPQSCYLGIDIGSHRTRICLWFDDSEYVVENRYNHNTETSNYAGDFPSALYVFDDDTSTTADNAYLIEGETPNRLSVSAKYVFYALTNTPPDALLEQYPLVHHLVRKKQDPVFKEKLRGAMITLLSVLRDRAMAVCRLKRLRVAKIGLTIPVQWTLEFEEVYRELVSEVFGIDQEAIYFFTETEALARYLFKHQADQMDPNGKHNTVLFFDFGGHNMNGCAFGVARDLGNPERNSFYRVGQKFGAGGGSEQWEHHIDEWFKDTWYGMNHAWPPSQHREDFLSRFRKQKCKRAELREDIIALYARPDDGATCRITLERKAIEDAWQKALSRPLKVARREVARLVSLVESGCVTSPLVVVSGGSARNPAVKSQMMTLCRQSGVHVVFTHDFDVSITYESAMVAKAASYVVSETLTLEQFFARGAAIGIQMKQSPTQGAPRGSPRIWDDSGALLLDLHHQPKANFRARYHDEFKLICDPFFERLPRTRGAGVAANLSYDLVYLGRRKQGTWSFRLSLEGSGDRMELVLKQNYRRRRDLKATAMKTLRLPLYFDGNSGCIHVGERDKTLDELDLGLPTQPNEMGEVDTDSPEESEEESDVDSVPDRASETASPRITDAGTVTGSSNADERGMFTTSVFAATDPWAAQVAQVEVGPIFDGLPRPWRIGPANRRV